MPPRKREETTGSILDDIRRAEEAAKQRLSAPPVTLASISISREKELVRTFAPECVSKNGRQSEYTAYWGDPDKHEENISKGYIPVVSNGVHVSWDELKLYKIPRRLSEDAINFAAMKSRKMVGDNIAKDAETVKRTGIGEERMKVMHGASDAEVISALDEMDRN